MSTASRAISRLLKNLSPDEARAFAKAAKTSVPSLRHIGKGRRGVSCEMAVRLVNASEGSLVQEELCEGCKARRE
ncbi:MAG: hypothetical protein ACHP7H_01465 [Hyphomicrobiales bacterium]